MNTQIVARPDSFFSPRTPLQAAAATITTATDTYYVSSMCFGSPLARTAKHSVTVTRLSDGAVAPSVDNLILKATGYASAAGIGRWASYREAMQALLELGIRFFEPDAVAL